MFRQIIGEMEMFLSAQVRLKIAHYWQALRAIIFQNADFLDTKNQNQNLFLPANALQCLSSHR